MNHIKWFIWNWVSVMRSPSRFWQEVALAKADSRVVWFGVVCLLVGVGFEALGQIFFVDLARTMMDQNGPAIEKLAEAFQMSVPVFTDFFSKQLVLIKKQSGLILIFLPLISYFAIYLFAGGLHFILRGFGLAKISASSYDATLYIVSFAQAPALLIGIPLIGRWIAMVWILVLLLKGLKSSYQLGSLAGVCAVMVPAVFLKFTWASALQLLANSVPSPFG